MSWNYEKGCEEKVAYADMFGAIYSPPFYSGMAASAVLNWTKAEAWVNRSRWAGKEEQDRISDLALKEWEMCEAAIMWDKRARIPEFRQRYIDWLAREKGIASDLSIADIDYDSLPLLERIIAKGYRELAKTEHPDLGGSSERFGKLKNAKVQLDRVLAEVGELLREGQ